MYIYIKHGQEGDHMKCHEINQQVNLAGELSNTILGCDIVSYLVISQQAVLCPHSCEWKIRSHQSDGNRRVSGPPFSQRSPTLIIFCASSSWIQLDWPKRPRNKIARFIDADFMPRETSLFEKSGSDAPVVWKRPEDYCKGCRASSWWVGLSFHIVFD